MRNNEELLQNLQSGRITSGAGSNRSADPLITPATASAN